MKVKPKEILVNLPIALTFNEVDEIPQFAANINTIIHGKVKIKYEELGTLGGQQIGIFYINRNDEFTELRAEFKEMIEAEEMNETIATRAAINDMQDEGGTPSLVGGEK